LPPNPVKNGLADPVGGPHPFDKSHFWNTKADIQNTTTDIQNTKTHKKVENNKPHPKSGAEEIIS